MNENICLIIIYFYYFNNLIRHIMSSSPIIIEQRMNKLLSNPNIDKNNIIFDVEKSYIWHGYIDLEKQTDEIIRMMNKHNSEVIYDKDLPLITSYLQSNHTFHIDSFYCDSSANYVIADENGYWHYVILNVADKYACDCGCGGKILRSYKHDGDIIYLNKTHNIITHSSLMKHEYAYYNKISINDNKELCVTCNNCGCTYYTEQINSYLDVNKLRALIPFIRKYIIIDCDENPKIKLNTKIKIKNYKSNEINFDKIAKLISSITVEYGNFPEGQDELVEFEEMPEDERNLIYFGPMSLNDFIKECEQIPGFDGSNDGNNEMKTSMK